MHQEKEKLSIARLNHFRTRLKAQIVGPTLPLVGEYRHSVEPVPFARRTEGPARPVRQGETWGKAWESAWFRLQGTVPKEWAGQTVAARLDFNGEALVFDASGCPAYGLTNGSVFDVHFSKDIYRLFEPCRGGEAVELWVEATVNQLFGLNLADDPNLDDPHLHGRYDGVVNRMELAVIRDDLWHLWLDVDVLLNLAQALPADHVRRAQVLRILDTALAAYRDDRRNAAAARDVLREAFDLPANPADLTVTAVGHAHLDVGWLWPVRESIRKSARTFASQGALFERYPDYVFGASQAVLYQMVKDNHPDLYEKIRGWVRDGRWEIQGGAWVECDCNVIGGESMVRQFVHGKNFFRDEFGVDVRNLWLPDVFGYSAAMPQILRRAGVDFFLTQKISWNSVNTFPHTTFQWQGIDGSRVLTHFPPENNYNGFNTPDQLMAGQSRFKEKDVLDEFLCLFGIGDGGGGPKEEYIERGLRMQELNGCPKYRFGKAQDFFDRLAEKADTLDTWVGELYLERHRATYTTQARAKLGNRRLEQALRLTEFLCACAAPDSYPRQALDGIWKTLLTNQFHDIIPGSSIHRVYEVAEREYAEGRTRCAELAAAAAAEIFPADPDALTLVNCLSQPWRGAFPLPAEWAGAAVADADGTPLPTQAEDGQTVVLVDLPGANFATLRRQKQAAHAATPAHDLGLVLENDLIRYEFAENGELTRAFDKELGRDALAADGIGNRLSLYVDRPYEFDAWDIDINYEAEWIEDARAEGAERVADGPVRQGLRFRLAIGESSRLEQTVHLGPGSKRLDFVTDVDWSERHRMLRVSFPVAVAADEASFEIQYGHVQRPTHRNTSWDMARFEVSAHRYADLSGRDYGVALLNDCKYGYKVLGNILDLNLLRSPTNPDPIADRGHHRFTYALLPHGGDLVASTVMAEAAMLNQPPAAFPGRAAGAAVAPCRVDGDGISLEVLKRAEKEDCRVIRLVETQGRISHASLSLPTAAALVETDLLEWTDGAEVAVADGAVAVTLQPFEIRTYKLVERAP
jgi:alpha-mannosidase